MWNRDVELSVALYPPKDMYVTAPLVTVVILIISSRLFFKPIHPVFFSYIIGILAITVGVHNAYIWIERIRRPIFAANQDYLYMNGQAVLWSDVESAVVGKRYDANGRRARFLTVITNEPREVRVIWNQIRKQDQATVYSVFQEHHMDVTESDQP